MAEAVAENEATSDPLLATLSKEMDIDVGGWFRVGGTGAGGYYQASPDVLVAVPRPEFVQTEEAARHSLAEFQRIAEEFGRPQSIIVLVDRVLSQDSKSRRVWSEEEGNRMRRSLALVCRSGLARAIGSFFIGLYRPGVPTKMFKTFDEALDWSKRQEGAAI